MSKFGGVQVGEVYIVFIGEQIKEREWLLRRKPRFNDMIILSHQSPRMNNNSLFQYIPLNQSENSCFYIKDQDIQIHFHHRTLQIFSSKRELTEVEVYEILSHFVLIEGGRVKLLGRMPLTKPSHIKRNRWRIRPRRIHLHINEGKGMYFINR